MRYGEAWRYEDPYKDYDFDNDGYPGEYVYGDDVYIDDYYMDEVWKPDRDFSDYWVSDKGRVYSVTSDEFIYGSPTGRCGHIDMSLYHNGIRYHKYLHRMVAEAFIPNPFNLPQVRHMDNDPSNNCADNLRWGTQLDNVHDCIKSGRFRYFKDEDIEKANAARRTPVVAVDLQTGEKIEYISQQEAARDLGMTQSSISRVLRGLSRHAHGYYFYYANDPKEIDVRNYRYSRKFAPIRAIDLENGRSYIFRGQTEASKALGISISSISYILSGKMRQSKGFTFEYAEECD